MMPSTCWLFWRDGTMERVALNGSYQRRWTYTMDTLKEYVFEVEWWKLPWPPAPDGMADCYIYKEEASMKRHHGGRPA